VLQDAVLEWLQAGVSLLVYLLFNYLSPRFILLYHYCIPRDKNLGRGVFSACIEQVYDCRFGHDVDYRFQGEVVYRTLLSLENQGPRRRDTRRSYDLLTRSRAFENIFWY
jgi:hypothetical protein